MKLAAHFSSERCVKLNEVISLAKLNRHLHEKFIIQGAGVQSTLV